MIKNIIRKMLIKESKDPRDKHQEKRLAAERIEAQLRNALRNSK